MNRNPDVQLRFPYQVPVKGQRLRLVLRGLIVLAAPDDGDSQATTAHLQAAGLRVEVDDIGLVSFPVADLRGVLDLPPRVVVLADQGVEALLNLLRGLQQNDTVIVSKDTNEVLNLSWVSPTGECNEPLAATAAAALLALNVPVVADPATWTLIHSASVLPVVRARARVNLDGFIEITTPVAQQLESLPIRGLFRVDESRFGIPLSCIEELDQLPGLAWDGPRPSSDIAPPIAGEVPLVLSAASRAQLRLLVDRLSLSRSQAVVWPRGSGRRVFCLAATEALDAFPLLVLCLPSRLWLWHRHLDLAGRRAQHSDLAADVRVLPYTQLAAVEVGSPAGIILDDLEVALGTIPGLSNTLRRLDGSVDTVRLSCSSALPTTPTSLLSYFSSLRPVEFRDDLPAAARYPAPVEENLRRHGEVYVLEHHAVADTSTFRRSSVDVVDCTEILSRALDSQPDLLGASMRARRERAELLLRWCSEGTDGVLSPKIGRAVQLTKEHLRNGQTVTVLVGSPRAQRLIEQLVRPSLPEALRFQVGLPQRGELCATDAVVVVEYPLSFDALDDFVVAAADSRGPRDVTLLHVQGTIEDRLAVIAAWRSDRHRNTNAITVLREPEIDFLLGHTTLQVLAELYTPGR
jgi:hypothetical protein